METPGPPEHSHWAVEPHTHIRVTSLAPFSVMTCLPDPEVRKEIYTNVATLEWNRKIFHFHLLVVCVSKQMIFYQMVEFPGLYLIRRQCVCLQHSDNRPRLTLFPRLSHLSRLWSILGDGDDDDNHDTRPGVRPHTLSSCHLMLTQCLVIAEITR